MSEKIATLIRVKKQAGLSATMADSHVNFLPQLLRSNMIAPYSELFSFGQDNITSVLEWELNPEGKKFNILYGGVGNARHVFGTLLDARKRGCKAKLNITMNNIHPHTLVKDIMVLTLCWTAGRRSC